MTETPPTLCPIHNKPLACPRCNGAKGGHTGALNSTPEERKARATKASHARKSKKVV